MKGFFKKIFGIEKKETSNMNPNNKLEDLDNYSYQWIKGDKIGKINDYKEVIELNGTTYLVFTDGSRISVDLMDEYIVKVERGFYEPAFDRTKQESRPSNLLPPPQIQDRPIRAEFQTIIASESAIAAILKKQKENWVDVDLNLTVNLPKKALWDVIISSFDDAEDEILDYVTKDLDIEVVREALRKSIKDIYSAKKLPNIPKNVRTQNTIPGQLD